MALPPESQPHSDLHEMVEAWPDGALVRPAAGGEVGAEDVALHRTERTVAEAVEGCVRRIMQDSVLPGMPAIKRSDHDQDTPFCTFIRAGSCHCSTPIGSQGRRRSLVATPSPDAVGPLEFPDVGHDIRHVFAGQPVDWRHVSERPVVGPHALCNRPLE